LTLGRWEDDSDIIIEPRQLTGRPPSLLSNAFRGHLCSLLHTKSKFLLLITTTPILVHHQTRTARCSETALSYYSSLKMVVESSIAALGRGCAVPVTTNAVYTTNSRCHCCGKMIKISTCEDEDNLSIHRKPSSSSMSTISIRDSLLEGMNSFQRRGIRCDECCKSRLPDKERKAADEDDHHFRPPGEIYVDQRDLPPRPRKNVVISCRTESPEDLVDLTDSRDVHSPSAMCNDSNATPQFRNSFDHHISTPIADNTTTDVGSFKQVYDRSRPSNRSGSSARDMRTLSPTSNSESSFKMILVSVMDIDEVPSDELAGTEPTNSAAWKEDVNSTSPDGEHTDFEGGFVHNDCAETPGTIGHLEHSDRIGEILELSPSEEEFDYAAKEIVETRSPVAELENIQSIQRQPVSPSSPLHDKARSWSILRDEELDNSDSDDIRDEKAAAEAYKGCADSADVCESSCSPKAEHDEFDNEREHAPSTEQIPMDPQNLPPIAVENSSRPTDDDDIEIKVVEEAKWDHCANPLTFLCSLR
jgi:hypothetical protein